MSDNSNRKPKKRSNRDKKAIRAIMAEEGVKYTQALRILEKRRADGNDPNHVS